jgi:hypothetical protein
MSVIRGNVKDIVFKYNSRVIVQTIVRHGGQKERDEIAAELKGRYKQLAQNKFLKVCSPFLLFSPTGLTLNHRYFFAVVPCYQADTAMSFSPHFNIAGIPISYPQVVAA